MISYEMKEGQRAYSFTLPKLPVGSYSIKASSSDGVVVTDISGKVVHLVNPADIPALNGSKP